MFEGMVEGLAFFTLQIVGWMLVGIFVSTSVAIIPGLGGLFALVMLLPLAYTLPPEGAIALLLSAMAVSGTANTVTGVLFGVPGSSTGVATILDGYPMAKKGEGGRALAAGLMASGLGGVIGAVALGMMLPAIRPIVMSLGSPEFFILIFGALLMMVFVGQDSPIRSLTAGLFGVMLSFVGLEMSSATPRYTFGSLYLWDGIRLAPLFIGLFAISEMMLLLRRGGSISSVPASTSGTAQLFQGIRDVFIKWRILVLSSIVGVIVGLAPGLGATGGQFVAYSQAARFSSRGKFYETGEVEGVIADEAADVPTILEFDLSDEHRSLVETHIQTEELGRLLMAPPGVPADRLELLREAVDWAMTNDDFQTDSASIGPIDPLGGAELEAVMESVMNAPAEYVDVLRAAREE